MPYFITDQHPDCPAWATVKDDGELVACHESEQDAIDQMVAISVAEEIEPGGTYEGEFRENIGDNGVMDISATVEEIEQVDLVTDFEKTDKDVVRSLGGVETRVNVADFEVRETADGMQFEGYASVFNSRSENLGGFTEFVAPGAFTRSLKSRNDVKLLWNHDAGQVLGSTRAKTMSLVEDERGLKVTATLPNTSLGRDTAELIRTGIIDSMSFGFNVIKDSWNTEGNERTLHSVRLFEVSIVAFPAYAGTAGTTNVRSVEKLAKRAEVDMAELEAALIKLESGEDLDEASRDLLNNVINKVSPSVTFEPEQEPTVVGDLGLLALKKKKLELLDL